MSESANPSITSGSTVQVRLPDGKALTVPRGASLGEVARAIGPRLAKDAIAGKIDGRLTDLDSPVNSDCVVQILTPGSGEEALEILRHSTSHTLAQAVKELWPEAKIAQ